MKTNQRIELLSAFGSVVDDICGLKPYAASQKNIDETLYSKFEQAIRVAHTYNGWFTTDSVLEALKGIRTWLTNSTLSEWIDAYDIGRNESKSVGLIMAGNIPLVGFHDFLSVFLSGHYIQMKLSSSDDKLWPIIISVLNDLDADFNETTRIVEKLSDFDAVIATGSNNSATFFESYFGKYPHIIRKTGLQSLF